MRLDIHILRLISDLAAGQEQRDSGPVRPKWCFAGTEGNPYKLLAHKLVDLIAQLGR
jgi:hypothetical protein